MFSRVRITMLFLFLIGFILKIYSIKRIQQYRKINQKVDNKVLLFFVISSFLLNICIFGVSLQTTKDLLLSILVIVIYTSIDISLVKNKNHKFL